MISPIQHYIVETTQVRLTVPARNEDAAKDLVCIAERCPMRAILSVVAIDIEESK